MGRHVITQQYPNPAAGADVSIELSNSDRVRVIAFTARLVTSSAVASRLAGLRLEDLNGVIYFEQDLEATQAASRTVRYSWARGAGVSANTALTGIVSLAGGLPWLELQPGDLLQTNTRNIDVADQWQEIAVRYAACDSWEDLQDLERIRQILGG